MNQTLPTIRTCSCDLPESICDPCAYLPDLAAVCNPVIDTRNPQLVVYSCFSRNFTRMPENARRLFLCLENVHPNFNECDYAISCQPMSYGDRYLRIAPWEYGFDLSGINDRAPQLAEAKTRFCNFIYSNNKARYIGTRERLDFCKQLMEYKHVDCPGRVLHNMEAPELGGRYSNVRSSSKQSFIRQYKFTIAWENTYGEGYCTEKLIEQGMDSLMQGRTVFVIAHRLSTVRNAKAIMVLELGEIIERGDHDDLIAQGGKYYQLYTGQMELS